MAFSRRQFLSRVRILTQSFPNRALATLLTVAILLVFLDGLSARGPHRINRLPEAATRCGFWSEMSAGISCR